LHFCTTFNFDLVNQPTPAIVAQSAVRRFPRWALLLLCLAYVLPGFVGREPWKNADIAAFGYMLGLASGDSAWFAPQMLGLAPEFDALLPYWLGAWAIQWAPSWLPAALAARIPFVGLLGLTLLTTWYSAYYLARSPQAQPVAFAFGGEAQPIDYARAMADGALLALIACLGLAQLAHESTPAVAQLAFTALAFYAVAAAPFRLGRAACALVVGLLGLATSGAPSVAMLLGLGVALASWLTATPIGGTTDPAALPHRVRRRWFFFVVLVTLCVAALTSALDLWRWRLGLTGSAGGDWRSAGRLLIWFTWPAWPLALWTLWRWRKQLGSRHVAAPLWFITVAAAAALLAPNSERSLLLGLPAMAALAAFALPTLRRSVAALIDWFTLLFFSGCAVVIWVVWIAMETGVPAKPAANVAKLIPGFVPSFSWLEFFLALAATIAWAWLVKWRAGRHRTAIWKSLVLPAGGATLGWLLLLTLWLPALDFARSHSETVRAVKQQIDQPGCAEVLGLSRGQLTAYRYHGGLVLRNLGVVAHCPWLIVDADAQTGLALWIDESQWTLKAHVRRAADNNESVLLYKRSTLQAK
jgi:hypothetical protein